jgi:hypothetical protein
MTLKSYILALHAALFAILLAVSPAGSGSMTLLGVGKVGGAAPPAYTGPGDVVASAKFWYGLRAYSSATRGTAAVNVCNSTGGVDVGCGDLSTDPSTGALVPATISGITCPGANCTIKTFHDQTTGNQCGGSCDVTQATILNRPTLVASCIGSLPCARFIAGNQPDMKSAGNFTQIQPITVSSAFFLPTGGVGLLITDSTFNIQPIAFTAGTTIRVFAGTIQDTAETYNTSHAVQAVLNGASSILNVDNVSPPTINPGTIGFSSGGASPIDLGNGSLGAPLTVDMFEVGVWASAFSSGNQTSICHNQFAFWGTATSC